MTITYHAANGATQDVNVAGNRFLCKITLGLWNLVGIPAPMTDEDSKLVARIIRNYASLQRDMLNEDSEAERYQFWHQLGYKQEYIPDIVFIETLAAFFEVSGGLIEND